MDGARFHSPGPFPHYNSPGRPPFPMTGGRGRGPQNHHFQGPPRGGFNNQRHGTPRPRPHFQGQGPPGQEQHWRGGGPPPFNPGFQQRFQGPRNGGQWQPSQRHDFPQGQGRGARSPNPNPRPQWGQQQNKNAQPGGKKQKVNKRDLPENNKFFCDICDRGYKDEDKFKEHNDGHEKCTVEGCPYVAAPKLVRLHFQLQHRSGMAKKIWQLESPEDLAKWKAERRKNYPTKENISKKEAVEKGKIARGEVLDNKYFGKMNRGNGRGRGRGRGRGQGHHHGDGKRPTDGQGVSGPESKKMRLESQGLPSMEEGKSHDPKLDPLAYVLEDDKDSEAPQEISAKSNKSPDSAGDLAIAGGLGNLMTSYGELSDSDQEASKTTGQASDSVSSKDRNQGDGSGFRGRGGRGRGRKQGRGRGKGRGGKGGNIPSKQPTLLEKLLAAEIRHERNVILQCVNYIIKKDFFGVGENPALPPRPKQRINGDEELWEV